ncbi:MAG: DUF1439 domain-containing protein [Pseudomonadota bacterium]
MNKFTKIGIVLALAGALLAACASLVGPRDIELPVHKMQTGIEKRFPLDKKILQLVDLKLSNPRLTMLEGERIGLSMDALVAPPFTGRSWPGKLALSGRLVLDAGRQAVLLAEPRIDSFALDGVDEARRQQFASAANALMAQAVTDMPVYHFRPEDLRYAGVQFVPTRISASARGLVVAVEPVRQ